MIVDNTCENNCAKTTLTDLTCLPRDYNNIDVNS